MLFQPQKNINQNLFPYYRCLCFLYHQVPYTFNHHSRYSTNIFQRFGFSSVSPQQSDKEINETKEQENTLHGSNEYSSSSGSEEASEQGMWDWNSNLVLGGRGTKCTALSALGIEDIDLSKDDLAKLIREKEGLLKSKDDEIKDMKDKVLRSYAEMENVMARTKRESENSKKYAVQVCGHHLLTFISMKCYELALAYSICRNCACRTSLRAC